MEAPTGTLVGTPRSGSQLQFLELSSVTPPGLQVDDATMLTLLIEIDESQSGDAPGTCSTPPTERKRKFQFQCLLHVQERMDSLGLGDLTERNNAPVDGLRDAVTCVCAFQMVLNSFFPLMVLPPLYAGFVWFALRSNISVVMDSSKYPLQSLEYAILTNRHMRSKINAIGHVALPDKAMCTVCRRVAASVFSRYCAESREISHPEQSQDERSPETVSLASWNYG